MVGGVVELCAYVWCLCRCAVWVVGVVDGVVEWCIVGGLVVSLSGVGGWVV